MIEIKNLNSGYRKLQVLFDISASFQPGKINTIVGPNGSGKSTLLKSIFGLATVYSGSVRFKGMELVGKPPHEIAKLGIAYLPQLGKVFENLSVEENMMMAGYTLDKSERAERLKEVCEMFPLVKKYWRTKAGLLSGGERQMVAMAMALLRRPKVMMFDEPTSELAPKVASSVLEKIVELRDTTGVTIVLVEQNAKKALEIGDRAYLLVGGRLSFEGGCDELLNHPQLSALYLGISNGS
ncbi:MAG: ABC transporter ATP-binding protein [Candidatus Terraquivivens tikiterensis]|uniref:ABC transporter ATP-binding protein n=1 Tax=Candidatus Terraquivivens tikiterensis TaxID=1980982 RepID=A0A2R7Y8A3_9ARCH|nr:MAG: ABC transporter ATP-binding protein [Candidatus Terraquivivens tikiterensis]